jgi:isopentenyl diphosphate isomerase/L-lactate dehydrogenase-like FMN-dependent dehydrogenase
VLQALLSGGKDAAVAMFEHIEAELRAVMLLVGAGTVADLRKAPFVVTGELPRWLKLAKLAKTERVQ